MSLIYCPECGHEISTAAVACPSCGRPLSPPPSQVPRVVVEREPKSDAIPAWVIAPVVLLGVLVLFGLIYLVTSSEDQDSNLSVNVNTRRAETASVPERSYSSSSDVSSIPPSTMPVTNTPGAGYPTSSQSVPGSSGSIPQSGTVVIDAKVSTRNGSTQAVRNTRFYLLDKDIESILADARMDPIEGQSLTNSLAIATADRERYGDFYRQAMSALNDHIKYAGSTDTAGKAQLGSVKPDRYYLFGVARTGEGFAMWNSAVSVIAGDNAVNLTPQQLTPVPSGAGTVEE